MNISVSGERLKGPWASCISSPSLKTQVSLWHGAASIVRPSGVKFSFKRILL